MEWNDKNWDKARDAHLRRQYGITLEHYERLFAQQNGVCAICGDPPGLGNTNLGRKGERRQGRPTRPLLAVDHDHVTGKVRGLLCIPCNRGIGFLKDSADVIRFALKYLEERV